MVRRAQYNDVTSMVEVHVKAFSGFFLTFLGPAFLRELYSAVIRDTSGIALVWEDKQVLGFVVGTDQPSGFYRRLLRQRWWRFGLAAFPSVLRRPSIAPRVLRALRKPAETLSEPGTGTLMSLAVLPDRQGQGIGRALVWAFLNEARHRGLKQVNLTTDAVDNEPTNRFYQSLGFTCVRSFKTPESRIMNEYVIDLHSL